MRSRITAIVLLSWACALDEPQGQGIAIGNPPGQALARVTVADGDDVAMQALELTIGGTYLEDCSGNARVTRTEPTRLELDAGTVGLDAGEWCVLGLLPDHEPTVLEGRAGEGSFRFAAELGRILFFSDGVTLDAGDTLVFELAEPDWIAATDFDLGPGELLELGGPGCLEDRLCERVRDGLMDRSGLYRDRDADGQVDPDERDSGADASGDSRRERRG